MRRLARSALLLAWLSLALAACTGTSEPDVPTLLVVGYGEGAGSSVALIEDIGLDAGAPGIERFVFLPASVQPLPATPVAYDVVERAGGRTELVVLSRNDPADPTALMSYLSFFNLSGIDPAAPDDFVLTPTRANNEIALRALAVPPEFCPVGVGVSADGNFAAITSNPDACGFGGGPADIFVLDTGDLTLDSLNSLDPLLPEGTFVDQDNNRLYYAAISVTNASIRWEPIDDIEVELDPPEVEEVPLGTAELHDIGVVGPSEGPDDGEDELVVLLSDSFVPIFDYQGAATLGDAVEVSSGDQLLLDDLRFFPNVLVLNGNLQVYESLLDEDPASTSLSVTAGAMDSDRGFVYFVDEARLCLFDLFTFSGDPERNLNELLSCAFEVPELTDPSFIAWTRAAVGPIAP